MYILLQQLHRLLWASGPDDLSVISGGFPPENIILGNAKNLVQFDIILDDAIHNVLETSGNVSGTHA